MFKIKYMFSKYFILLCLVCVTGLYGQRTVSGNSNRISLYGNYAFEDSFDSYYDYGNYYQGKIKDGFQYGVGFEFEVRSNSFLEIMYLRQDVQAPTQYYNGGLYDKFSNFDVGMNYIMLGGNQSFGKLNQAVEGFGGLLAGVGVLDVNNPKTNYSETLTKFAWGAKAGVILWPSKNVGIKLQAQLLSIVQSIGGGVYFGPGGPSSSISTYSSLYQFSVGGGLVFDLGK